MVEWSCTEERINKRGPYIFVEWSCTNKINKSMRTLTLDRMVVQPRKKTQKKEDHMFWSKCRVHITETN